MARLKLPGLYYYYYYFPENEIEAQRYCRPFPQNRNANPDPIGSCQWIRGSGKLSKESDFPPLKGLAVQ